MELAEAARAQIDAGDLEAALAMLAGAENSLPLHAGHIYSWRAALLAELGRTDAALDALDAALAGGCRFKSEWLRDNPRLAALRGLARFDDVVDRAAARYAQMQADTRPMLEAFIPATARPASGYPTLDRKSTRLNSSLGYISYAVFCLKKKNRILRRTGTYVNSHTVLDGIITTIMATIQRINILTSR